MMFKKLKTIISKLKKHEEIKQEVDPMIQIENDIKKYASQNHVYREAIFDSVAQRFLKAIREDMRCFPYDEKGRRICEVVSIRGGIKGADGKLIHDFGATYPLADTFDKYGHSYYLYARNLMTLTMLKAGSEIFITKVLDNFVVKTDIGTYYFNASREIVKEEIENGNTTKTINRDV